MMNHRGPEFQQLQQKVTGQLKEVFQTKNDLVILTGSGSGAMEAAVVNMFSPQDRVLSATCGVFGDRFATIAKTFGVDVVKLEFPMGTAVDPAAIDRALREDKSIKAVIVTHNETSTGVTNDLETIARVIREHGKLSVVDAVSSMGAISCPVDAWGLDVVITGSQKALMIPPGLSFVSISPKAWEYAEASKIPSVYWDFKRAKKSLEKWQNPWTPAVSLFNGLDAALDMMFEEGMENVYNRHIEIGAKTRAGLKARGLELLVTDESVASNTVTAFKNPEGISGSDISKKLRTEQNIVVAGGQGALDGKIIRIGHLGYVNNRDIDDVFRGLDIVLPQLGFDTKKSGK
jgi:aspartate aminotransferase-like enzyme